MKNIVIFASGTGTNAENIITYFSDSSKNVTIRAVITNNRKAEVLDRADRHKINAFYVNSSAYKSADGLLNLLNSINPDLIILSGFLRKIPKSIIYAFPEKIINIHPALLPKYGGKGMYGMYVHQAVYNNKEDQTGITIHYVNENYDEGAIIFQAKTQILDTDTPEEIAGKVHRLEYEHFPKIIEKLLYE